MIQPAHGGICEINFSCETIALLEGKNPVKITHQSSKNHFWSSEKKFLGGIVFAFSQN